MTLPVDINQLSKGYDRKPVLENISLALPQGSITALLGPNGAGKTTLLGCLLGLLVPDKGRVSLWGESAGDLSALSRSRIGFVPQTLTGLTWFRVGELLDYFAAYRDNPEAAEDKRWADWAGLDRKSRISALSGGERQRLAIVLALRFSPDLLILDEPVASLDPQARHDFIALLHETARQRGATILLSSHILSDLERLCSRFVILSRGRIVTAFEDEDLQRSIRHLAHAPDAALGLSIMAQAADGSVWVKGWTPAHEGLSLERLPGDLESLFLALTR
ncbi:ABC transporter ATP-binding protein [Asaia krungthepensis]|nr:ABC transporter ATP-binding protein [Asaia krungthepensis]